MKTLRFHRTENIACPIVYDANTDEEYQRMYDLLPLLNELNWENKALQCRLAGANELLSDALEYFPENSNFGIGDKIREYQRKYKG